jgi:ATP-dependent Clp protease protease subunit
VRSRATGERAVAVTPHPPIFISFQAEVNQATSEVLISVIAKQIQEGHRDIHLLLSTPGGSTTNGISIYNTLRALPISLTTHNVGNVNSIGNVIYLAGERRRACATSSFMFHGVGFDILQPTRWEEKNLMERLDNLRNDQGLIADIISSRTNIDPEETNRLFLSAAFLRAEEAKAKGIVHDIVDAQVPEGAPFLQLVFQR